MSWGPTRPRLRTTLVVALGLHAALLWIALRTHRAPRAPIDDVASQGVVWLDEEPLSRSPSEPASPPSPPSVSTASEAARGHGAAPVAEAAAAPERSTTPQANAVDAVVDNQASGDGVAAGEPAGGLDPSGQATPEGGATLSLDQLGIGKNPFLPDHAPPPKPKDRTREFKRALATEIVASDQRRGLGPEGPVLTRLEQETRKVATAATSSARFRATTDQRGLITSFELIDATADHGTWQALAGRMLGAMAGVFLRVPKTGHGVTLDMKVSSEVLLPSGAEPGLGIEVAGIELKKAGGKHSPKVSVLKINPRMEQRKVTMPDGRTIDMPYIEIMDYLNLAGDPVDIGKKAQRVVHARLERLWANADAPGAESK